MSYRFADSLRTESGGTSFVLILLASCMTYTIAVFTVKNSWWWTEELSETYRFLFQNKFEKLVHLFPEEWRRLRNEELNDLYSSPNIVRVIKSRRMRWAGHMARMGEESGAYRVLVGKPEGKRPMGKPRRRWVDNIRMDLQEVGCGYVDWIGLAQDRDRWRTLVSAVMNLLFP